MDKKFLSAEEAIEQFGLDTAEFQRLVDAGELRALADRGTWKYRREEIERLIRDGLLKGKRPSGTEPSLGAGSEELTFLELDEEALSAGATIEERPLSTPELRSDIERPSDMPRSPLADSVSDVRMVNEPEEPFVAGEQSQQPAPVSESMIPTLEGPVLSESHELPVAESLSELDIVIPSASSSDQSSAIVGAEETLPTSDSDVKVVSETPAQGASVLASSGSSVSNEEDSGISLSGEGSGLTLSDSDVKIADSGLTLERSDSGISLERSDSGISLESSSVLAGSDSGLSREDSGISLGPGDSGLALEAMADSGISLEVQDSGIQLDQKTGRPVRPTQPAKTEVEIAGLDSREFPAPELAQSLPADQTAMLINEVDEAEEAAPPAKSQKGPGLSGVMEQDVEELEIAEDLDVAEIGEDEAVEEILEASDEVFAAEDSAELSGAISEESVSAVSAPSAVRASLMEPAWGLVTVIPVAVCAVLLLLNGLMLWEGVSTMWTGQAPPLTGALVDPLGGLF